MKRRIHTRLTVTAVVASYSNKAIIRKYPDDRFIILLAASPVTDYTLSHETGGSA